MSCRESVLKVKDKTGSLSVESLVEHENSGDNGSGYEQVLWSQTEFEFDWILALPFISYVISFSSCVKKTSQNPHYRTAALIKYLIYVKYLELGLASAQ